MDTQKKKEIMLIVDGSSVVYRSFHALPQTFSNSKGQPTNAIYGFTRVLIKLLRNYCPEYMAVAFDVKGPTFRHGMFKDYKAERPPMPDSLSSQMPYIKAMVSAFRIPALESGGYEADDIIACLVSRFKGSGIKILLVTGDKDMCQLVSPDVVILDYATGDELGGDGVYKKFGVSPEKIPDLLALAGDSSDNIPGVHGIGFKRASALIREFGSLAGVYENIAKIGHKKISESLVKHRQDAFLSRDLATLNADVRCDAELQGLKVKGPDADALKGLLSELEFGKLLADVKLSDKDDDVDEKPDFKPIRTEGELKGFVEGVLSAEAREYGIALALEGAGALAPLKGLAFADRSGNVFFIRAGGNDDGFLTEEEIFSGLKPVFEDISVKKNSDNLKSLCLLSRRHGAGLNGLGIDVLLASYLLDPSNPKKT
ncbi:MAG: 5'-3' exonuclease H3TH domain-containing protein, partial [Deltaproteobacteria bacterium]